MTDDFYASLFVRIEKLQSEVDDLKMLNNLVNENLELRSKLHVLVDGPTPVRAKSKRRPGKKSTIQLCDSSVDESTFRAGICAPPYTSSPLTTQRSARLDTLPDKSGFDHERLLGEVGFQLERRILSHVFYKQTRLYGFTVQNIQDKIIQMSTHPVTGQVDKAYRSELTKRYEDLMDRLGSLGYDRTLHPPFSEFIINTYGILQERPDTHTAQDWDSNNPEVLWRLMVEKAPPSLVKDLLILFSSLCYMAENDGKRLILW